ncbi:hypothetical protein [Aquibacillus kalidii]|uniref:hypothetical protein n=1 Tax=Aquibacillus kalidii TaxID=2762597 RepID=UPI001648036D|nr:hypothetical protein [Aquibacillus kalidii]
MQRNFIKKVTIITLTLAILATVNFGITYFLDQKFIDFAFIVGIAGTVVIYFFSSSGGYTSRTLDLQLQSQTGMKQEQSNNTFNPNLALFSAVFYTLLAAIFTFIYYKDYFI